MSEERSTLLDHVPRNDWFEGVKGRAQDTGDGFVRLPRSDWQEVVSCWSMGERLLYALRAASEGLISALDRQHDQWQLSLNVKATRDVLKTVLARKDWFRDA